MRREQRAFSRVGRSSGVVLVDGAFWQGLWGKGWRGGLRHRNENSTCIDLFLLPPPPPL